jgi:4-hydroxyphenylpyruvate dioxygenase-like putative hemolysin
MTSPDDLLTINALAAAYRRDRRTVAKMLQGVEPASTTTYRGRPSALYRRGDVAAIVCAPTDGDRLKEAFERLHGARADVLALKRKLRAGTLLDANAVRNELLGRILIARSAMLGITGRYGGRLVALQSYADRAKARATLKALLDEAMREIEQNLCAPFSWEQSR